MFPMEGNNAAKVEARANQRAKEGKVAKERAKESIRKEKAMAVEAATTFVAFVEVMATGAMSVLTRMVSIRCLALAVVLGKFKELPLTQQAPLDPHQHVVPEQLQRHHSLCLPLQRLRLVKMYHVATPPAEQPEFYEVRSDFEDDGEGEWFVRMVSSTPTLWHQVDAGDEARPGDQCWSSDPLMDWYQGLPQAFDWCQSSSC